MRRQTIMSGKEMYKNKKLDELIITNKEVADETLTQQNIQLSKLNRFAVELSNLSSNDNLEVFIAKQVKEIACAEVVLFSEYNPANQTITPKHIIAESEMLEKIVSLLGSQVQGIKSVVSDEIYREMTTERIGKRETLYEACFGAIPRPVGAAIQALLKVDRFIGLPYLIEGKLYGTSLLAMSKGQPDPSEEILENFIHLAAISLRRKKAEEELKNKMEDLTNSNKEIAFQNKEKNKRAAELIIINKQLEQLIQLNADKDLFISILAHDLRSPFNALLGLSELLIEDIRKLNINEIEDIANNINKSAQNSFKLLEDLLMWARAQSGKIPFNPQKLSFADICKNILENLNPNADAKNIALDYSKVDHLTVFADIDLFKAVLRNLVSNAIKFTNSGGAININAEENSGNVTISVSDNGIGIKPNNLAKLFNISQVLTTKGTAKETGTGLGLVLCKEFVEKHGGKIWAESEVRKGSDFKFTLPYNAEPEEKNSTKNVVSADGTEKRQ